MDQGQSTSKVSGMCVKNADFLASCDVLQSGVEDVSSIATTHIHPYPSP